MNKGRCNHTICPEAKAEVAREIFGEIEKAVEDAEFEWGTFYGVKLAIAELKKKYTEGKDTNVPPKKDFFTPEEVRKMSPQEVRQNYQAIMKSMKEW